MFICDMLKLELIQTSRDVFLSYVNDSVWLQVLRTV
jgi:hypothetical protein